MNDSAISSNTPIFTRLAAERGYDPSVSANVLAFHWPTLKAQEAWIAKPVPKMTPTVPEIVEMIHLEQLVDPDMSFSDYVTDMHKRFCALYPSVETIEVSTEIQLDGSQKVIMRERKSGGVSMIKSERDRSESDKLRQQYVQDLAKGAVSETFAVGGEATVLPPVFETKRTSGLVAVSPLFESNVDTEPRKSLDDFVGEMLGNFRTQHPYATIEDVEYQPQGDGSVTAVITAKEPRAIGENVPQTLYMPPSTRGSDEE